MKSYIPLLLVIALILTFTGCSYLTPDGSHRSDSQKYPAPEGDVIQQTEPTVAPVVDNEAEELNAAISMVLNPVQEDEIADDGTVVYSYHYQDVTVSMPSAPDVQNIIQESIRELTKFTRDQSRAAASWAKEMHTQTEEWATHYTHVYYTPNRIDQSVISITAQMIAFNGGTHPNSTTIPMNFNAETGQELKITEIIRSEDMLNTLKDMVFGYLEDNIGREQLMDGYDEIVEDRFSTISADSANWYLTNDGLVYYFVPYEIAAYRYGTVEALLCYEDLKDILKEEYLPKSEPQQICDLQAAISSELDKAFDAVHTVTLDAEGEHITLYGLEEAARVTVTVGYWGIDDNLFYPIETLFCADKLSTQECIELVTYIPDTIPNIRIQVGGKNGQTVYLSQSGDDGRILLLKDGEF